MSSDFEASGIFIPLPAEFLNVFRTSLLQAGIGETEADEAVVRFGADIGNLAAQLTGERADNMKELRANIEAMLNQTAIGRVEKIFLISDAKRQLGIVLGDTAESLGYRSEGLQRRCLFTSGYLTGVVVYLIGFDCRCVETKCVSLGDEHCMFMLQPVPMARIQRKEDECTQCGTHLESDWVRCPKCMSMVRCYVCGKNTQPSWRACPYCSAVLDRKTLENQLAKQDETGAI